MTVDVASVGPNATLKQVAELLVERGISGVPVVAADHRVLGVVSESDIIVKAVSRPAVGDLLARLAGRESADERRRDATTDYEAMTEPALTIGPDRPLSEAARVMLDAGVNRLPVVAGGRLAGIVTRADLVRAFIRPDGEIWEELRTDVGARRLALSPDDLEIEVRGGQVTIRGQAASSEAIDLLEAAAHRVAGVVSVDCSGVAASAWAEGDES
jgi:CBS domain-containing protein